MGQLGQVLHLFRVYRGYLGRRIYLIFTLTIGAVLAESVGIAMLLPLFFLLDRSGTAADMETGGLAQAIQQTLAFLRLDNSLFGIVSVIVVFFLLRGVLKLLEGAYKGYLEADLMRATKNRAFRLLGGMDYRFYTSRNTGHFVNLVSVQINYFVATSYSYLAFCISVVTFLGYTGVAFLISPGFTGMAMVAGVGILFALKSLSSVISRYSRLDAEEQGTLNKMMVQTVQSFKYLVSTASLGPLQSALQGSIGKLARYMFRKNLAVSFTDAVREPLAMAVVVAIIVLQISVFGGNVAAIMVAVLLIYRAMTQLGAMQINWQKTLGRIGSIELVERELAEIEKRQEKDGRLTAPPLEQGIVLENVSFRYAGEGDRPVLQNISLEIPARQTVGLVGESGAGKSTLVDVLTLLLSPDEGRVLLDGQAAEDLHRASWRAQIGFVSQETVVFDDTVGNNICLWEGDYRNDPDCRERVRQAAREAHALDFIEALPEGFDTRVGDRGILLSGGQRQRLFIARELYKQPRLLILDEATSALDSASEAAIQESIDALRGRLTVIIIAHRLSTLRNADTIFVLEQGRVVESGPFATLRDQPDSRFRRMVDRQQL